MRRAIEVAAICDASKRFCQDRRDIVAAENRRADRIRKQNLPAVGAPEPRRQVARGVRNNPRVVQEREKRFRSVHQINLRNLSQHGTD